MKMVLLKALRGYHHYFADLQVVYRLGFRTTQRYACAVPARLNLNSCVCHYTTDVVNSNSANKSKENTVSKENNPDSFGDLRNKYIERSSVLHRKLVNKNVYRQRADYEHNKKTSTEEPKKSTKEPQKSTEEPQKSTEDLKKSDVFGSIGKPLHTETDDLPSDDEGDKIEEAYHQRVYPKHWQTVEYFTRDMRKYIRENRLGDALALFTEMKKTYIIKPDAYMMNVLIGGCGRSGYNEMAFKLFKEMLSRRLEPDGSTYTGLFNSCATSPFPDIGLIKATRLYEKLTDKGVGLNAKTYHAAIKAFGRCGDLQMAFHLVDEMVVKGVGVTTETFNFLLSGCVSDRATGFLQAIRVWKKLKSKRMRPDLYSYNLLLRIVRDCGLGDLQVAEQLLFNTTSNNNSDIKRLQMPTEPVENGLPSRALSSPKTQLPDVLSPYESFGNEFAALQEVDTASKRLMMLGGLDEIVHRMMKDKVQPQIKTFTELLEIISCEKMDEEHLLEIMAARNVRPDVDFFNVLIKKRNTRGDFESAKDVLQLISKNSLHVDIATFGTLAIGCRYWENAQLLLNDMKEAGFRPNIQIMGTLAKNACVSKRFWYLIDVLKIIKENEVQVDPKLINELETCIVATNKFIADMERKGEEINNKDSMINSFQKFMLYYKTWLQEMKIDLPGHPWEAYGHEPAKHSQNKNIM